MTDNMNNAIDVAYQTEVSIESKSTEQLTVETNTYYRQAEQLAGMSAAMLAEAGRRLIEIKGRIPYGQFGEWCENNLNFSQRKANRMMQLAQKMENKNSIFADSSMLTNVEISTVWALLAAPEEVAAEVIETNDVTDMTVRELKEEIKRIKEEHETAISELEGEKEEALKDTQEALTSMYAAQTEQERLEKRIKELEDSTINEEELADLREKLEKEKAKNKRQKEQIQDLKASTDAEIQKRLEEASIELANKAKEEAFAESEAEIKKHIESIDSLKEQIARLSSDNEKLGNTSLLMFKVYIDELQDIYFKINDIITEENMKNEENGAKMRAALQKIVEGWKP